ncbi:glutaminyl-tRNA synthetase [Plasmodium falciparum RAJ116]|uniref:glutamine--tRNA ligase n=1 Tax=Plasmodium falciparum RAJ116 TaxID=580058 RepID=A0A0L0CXK1_PLAFA|nr:glutaminyl-tRNA synthetase [Plasmodium falciparum RAJ116]
MEKIYSKNKLDYLSIIFNFYSWYKRHFKGTLLINENSNIKNTTLIELLGNKKLLLNEINACEAILKLNEHHENYDSSSGTCNVNNINQPNNNNNNKENINDNNNNNKENINDNNNNNKENINDNNNNNKENINDNNNNNKENNINPCSTNSFNINSFSTNNYNNFNNPCCSFSCNIYDYYDILKIEELKDFLKDFILRNKKINKEFFDTIEEDMTMWKKIFFFGQKKRTPEFLDFLLFYILKKENIHFFEEETRYINLHNWFLKNKIYDISNDKKEDNTPSACNTNFIQQIIEEDLKNKKHTHVITRFPPEPNGYLHLGHAKSICLNFGLSNKYGGRTHLRFDDTNPVTEEIRYIESIKEDVKWLGYDWKEHLYFASNYFEQLYEWAKILIKQGDAYVDDQSIEEIRKNRGNLKDPGVDSPYRNRTVEENLQLFENMKNGLYKEGEKVLRAKINMKSGNMNLRDPILYRIMYKIHPKTKNKWVIYPMYDYAHGQSDSIEKITHSICTLEFETHRPLYEWFQEKLHIFKTRQIEFARLNVTYMVMSKRKLLTLVNEKYVKDWDDPRMPTISGMRRRGYSPDAIKDFCNKVGIAKRENMIPIDLLEFCVREDMDKKAIRLFAILKPLKKDNVNRQGGDGDNKQGGGGDNKKVKATIHWLCAKNSLQAEFRMYDKLFTKPNPESNEDTELVQKITSTAHLENNTNNQGNGKDEYASDTLLQDEHLEDESKNAGWRKYINTNSLIIHKGLVENYSTRFKIGDPIQFERVGFFTKDKDTTNELPVFNLTVPLVDNTMLKKKKEDLLQKELDKLKREKIAAERKLKKEQKKIREQKKKEQN